MRQQQQQTTLRIHQLPVIIFLTLAATNTVPIVSAQKLSPCPEIFSYEPSQNTEQDRWYGIISLQTPEDLNGIWIRLVLDRPAKLLGNWFGDAVTSDNKDYTIRNAKYKLEAGPPVIVRFFVQYNAADTVPSLQTIRLNGKTVCPDDGVVRPPHTRPQLHLSKVELVPPDETDQQITTPLSLMSDENPDINADYDTNNETAATTEMVVAPTRKKTDDYVKLTTKQGFVLNQLLAVFALNNIDSNNSLCKNHTNEFKDGLRRFEPWALQMLDSSSKLQPGILIGNLVEFGSFTQCIQIYHNTADSGPIIGKHCLIKVNPNINLIKKVLEFRNVSARRFKKVQIIVESNAFSWSVCVPQSCHVDDIYKHFNRHIMEFSEGLDVNVSLDAKHCVTIDDDPVMGTPEYSTIAFLAFFVISVLITSLIDWRTNGGKGPKNKFVDTFSAYSNFQRILAKGEKSDLDCIHGMRFLSTCYVVIGHRYLMAMFFPVTNGLEILDWVLNYTSTIIIGGTTFVDSFFMMSGMLVSHGFFDYVTKTGKFNFLFFYVHRFLRITPALAIVVLIYVTLVQHLGSGPLWYDTYRSHQKPCQEYWWSTLLHIQAYINPQSLCIIQTWYLSCDMAFFYASPLILYPLWKWPTFGYINLVFLYFASIAVNFYLAWVNEYEGGMPITNQLFETKYFQKHYIAPHVRASPYIIGIALGYAIFNLRGRKVAISPSTNVCLWILSILLMTAAVLGCHVFQEEFHDYNRLESSMFLSCSRSAWTAGLLWMVWSCVNGHGGFINYLLSAHIFRVLGRVSYGIFLLHMLLQFLKSGAAKFPIYFSNFYTIYESFADIVIMIFVGFVFTIFFELPLIRAESLLFKRKNDKKIVKVEPITLNVLK